jgi:acyl-[acyl-carrier-protein]-phospholipid O-acyltransferase/long-chain-fatty-acid--[acyl-carrier-protein] ligase
VLFVQTQNAFNDNFVKFVLMGLAMAVATGSTIGDNVEYILAGLLSLPFLLLAPISGFFADRYSKREVIWWCLVFQLAVFILIGIAILQRSIEVAIFGFFLLAVQSTFFSPAKQGILKEIVGSDRLGFANGLMSMLTMGGILGGMWLSGVCFDNLLRHYNAIPEMAADAPWRASLIPVAWAGVACLVALAIGFLVQRTPDHPSETFHRGIWVQHFTDLVFLFKVRLLRLTALAITAYWLIANTLALGLIQFAKEIFPDASRSGRMTANAEMLSWVFGGLMIGSLLVSYLSRQTIRRRLVPYGGVGMALGLVGAGLFVPATLWWNLSLSAVGFASGFFVVPLNAWLQDLADEVHRGRAISALNLLTASMGFVASGLGVFLKMIGLTPSQQMLVLVPGLLLVSYLLARLVKAEARP